jgi:dTMP kinase
LRGEFGDINQVSPYLASLTYALDRASAKNEMEFFLKKGGYIIANRYATSNMAHQGAKFSNKKGKDSYLKWVYELEYKIHRIPKEDIVVYLYVPWQIGSKLTENREERKYLHGRTKDIHEKDTNHLIQAEKMYLSLAKRFKHWVKIDCVIDGKLLPPQEIHKKVIEILRQRSVIDK